MGPCQPGITECRRLDGEDRHGPLRLLVLPDGTIESLLESVRTDEDIVARCSVEEVPSARTLERGRAVILTYRVLATTLTDNRWDR
jgi:hypothetical protein